MESLKPLLPITAKKDFAVPGSVPDNKYYGDVYQPIKSSAQYLECRSTGDLFPNMPPFNQYSDILKPYLGRRKS